MVGKLPDVIPFSARTTLPRAIREYLRVTACSTTATEEAFQQQNNACLLSQKTAILLESCPTRRSGVSQRFGDTYSSYPMFKAIRVGKHGGPEMMKLVTNATLPTITSSQVRALYGLEE